MSPLTRLVAGTAGLTIAYFAIPVTGDGVTILRMIMTTVALAGVTVVIERQVRHQLRAEGSPLWSLGLALVGGVLLFAMADYLIAITRPGEFAGLQTRLDALYFTLTTLATVGYGDVHAVGQLARTMVSVQLVFNLVVFTTAASVLMAQVRTRARR